MTPFWTTNCTGKRQCAILKLRNSVYSAATNSVLWPTASVSPSLNAYHDVEYFGVQWWLRVPLMPFAWKSAGVSITCSVSTRAFRKTRDFSDRDHHEHVEVSVLAIHYRINMYLCSCISCWVLLLLADQFNSIQCSVCMGTSAVHLLWLKTSDILDCMMEFWQSINNKNNEEKYTAEKRLWYESWEHMIKSLHLILNLIIAKAARGFFVASTLLNIFLSYKFLI